MTATVEDAAGVREWVGGQLTPAETVDLPMVDHDAAPIAMGLPIPAEPSSDESPQNTNPHDAAVDFLRRMQPGGPWVLTAIVPDGGTTTATFGPETEPALRYFIRHHDGRRNLYFTVNGVEGSHTKKPKKTDMRKALFLHVDIDAPKVEGDTAEQATESIDGAKRRAREMLQAYPRVPTAVVDSGNGIQAFWRLDPVIVLDGADATEMVESRNKALASELLGDMAVHNVDRILRLPGTKNLPNRKKRECGFIERQTKIQKMTDHAYAALEFPADKGDARDDTKPKGNGHDRSAAAAQAEGEAPPPINIDDLQVSARIRHVIRTGADPDDPARYTSRSEAVFAVLVAMTAAGCGDAAIAAVMLDPALPIGDHVRAQRNSRQYLARQIAKARVAAIDPEVAAINEKYALVIAGDRAVVLEEYTDADGRSAFRLLPKSTFETWYANRTVPVGEKRVKLAQHWLQHPQRRQYSNIVFAPGREPPGVYNLWPGFAVEPRPGDCAKFVHHLRFNVCRDNEAHYNWVIGWFADIVQHPAEKCGTSLVVRGKQGTGKTIVGKVIGSILGQHYTIVADPRYITGRFNSHLVSCLLLHADESFWAGDHDAEGNLKNLITGHEQLIEYKNKEPFRVRNYVRLFVTSNSDWVVPAGLEERRFAVLDIGEDHMQDTEYFAAIDAEMKAGGYEALLHYLLHFDLSLVDLRKIPRTTALMEQAIASMTPEQSWWLDTLRRGTLPGPGGGRAPSELLHKDYIRHAQQQGARRRSIETKLGMTLRKLVPAFPIPKREAYEVYGKWTRGNVYRFPSLRECRDHFSEQTQSNITWDDAIEWEGHEEEDIDIPF